MPAMVAVAEWNALKPIIGPVIRLMNRWSCSKILFKYLTCRTSTVRPAPVNFKITFTACRPARLAPLLSITTRSGTPFELIARLKNHLCRRNVKIQAPAPRMTSSFRWSLSGLRDRPKPHKKRQRGENKCPSDARQKRRKSSPLARIPQLCRYVDNAQFRPWQAACHAPHLSNSVDFYASEVVYI